MPVFAAEAADDEQRTDILVVGQKVDDDAPITLPRPHVSIDEARIAATVNAVSVEDTLKYLPSLVVRKRHIGDNFAPIATRTSGLGSSARSLIFADGALLSALIGNNNGNGSPRWTLVTPEEIERIDVLYGPSRLPIPGTASARWSTSRRACPRSSKRARRSWAMSRTSVSTARDRTLRHMAGFRIGGRPLRAACDLRQRDPHQCEEPAAQHHDHRRARPIRTGNDAAAMPTSTAPLAPIRVLGVGGLEHHVQDTYKLKAALDLGEARG